MKKFLYENSLSLTLFLLFVICLGGQVISGHLSHNSDQREHDQQEISLAKYLTSGHFLEAVFENWESEFLQMWAFVLLTISLRQKGSADSKKLDEKEAEDRDPARLRTHRSDAPWPVKKGGWILALYKHTLGFSLLALFLASFVLHACAGVREYNDEQALHGKERVPAINYIATARFWFESFQNWQSEFLSVGVLIVLSIFLREKGSPQSKPVDAPHSETGGE